MTTDAALTAALADLATESVETVETDLSARVFGLRTRMSSPVGDVFVGFGPDGVNLLRRATTEADFLAEYHRIVGRPSRISASAPPGVAAALTGLDGTGLAYDLSGLGGFAQDVLAAARTIPRGEVRSYGWVAREIGRPRAVRAVGTALGRNPVPLLIPCHRVVPAGRSVGGYIFGTPVKEQLLRAESYEFA